VSDPDLTAARDLIAAGRFDAALKHLTTLTTPSPRRDLLLGAAHTGRRDHARALPHLRRAVEDLPGDPEALFHLANVHLLASDAGRAIALFETVAASTPCFPGIREALVSAYRRDARYPGAIRLADMALADGHASDDLLYEKALCHLHLGEAEAALTSYDALLAGNPDHAAAWCGSHAPALHLTGLEDALRRLHNAVSCAGANGKYWAYLWVYNRLDGRLDAARAILDDKLAKHPKRRPLADSVSTLLDALSPEVALFGISAFLLHHALAQATVRGLVLEFGVRRGTSINQIAAEAGQTVHGFDSFEGLPEAWGSEPQGILTTGRELPSVRDNVTLHPGWFEDTLPAFLTTHPEPVRFVNIDSDIYSSACTVLTALAGRIRPGTVLVFDEYIGNRTWAQDEYKAFQEYVQAYGVRYEVIALAPYTKQVAMRITGIGQDQPLRQCSASSRA